MMKFGLNKEQYNYINEVVVKPLKNENAEVWCYGSRARNTHHKFSDLDLMVVSEKNLTTKIEEIKELLSNSNFPYKVDIVQLQNFAKAYLPSYEKDKIKWD